MNISPYISEYQEFLIETRRTIHQNPELNFEELQTAELILSVLNQYKSDKLKVYSEIGVTGVMAILDLSKSDDTKCIMLRADMDALPINENNDFSFKSKNANKMHACGHDGHVAILLTTFKIVMEKLDFEKYNGIIKFVFQPAEEKGAGALKMIQDVNYPVLKFYKQVDYCFGLHLCNLYETGVLVTKEDNMSAHSQKFSINITGLGGHASQPHMTKDAVLIGCNMVVQLQQIVSRFVDPEQPAVITIGKVEGGQVSNVIAKKFVIEGTIRTYKDETRHAIHNQINQIIEGFKSMYGCEITIEKQIGYPSVINTKEETERVFQILQQISETKTGNMGLIGEDFGFFLQEVKGNFFLVGSSVEKAIDNKKISKFAHHSPEFQINEDSLGYGVSCFLSIIESYLLQ